MNELERMQQEIAQQNAARGQMRPPPRAVDEQGYEAPSAPPPPFEDGGKTPKELYDTPPSGQVISGFSHTMPVAQISLVQRKIYGSIGTFDLTDEDVSAFTLLATQAMRRAIDAICAAPERSVATAATPVKVKRSVAKSSVKSTKGKYGTKRGRPTKSSGGAPSTGSPST